MAAPARVVVFRALNLGDLLVSVPALRALRSGFPEAEIDFIGLPWARSFLERYGYVDRFMEFPGYPDIAEGPNPPRDPAVFLANARARRYELAIQLHGSGVTSNTFVQLLGAARMLAHVPAGSGTQSSRPGPRDSGLGTTLIARPWRDDEHEVERWLRLVGLLAIPAEDEQLEFPITDADERELSEVVDLRALERQRPLIGVHPGARPPARRWAPQRYGRLSDELIQRFGARIVLLGGPGERPLADAVEAAMEGRALNLAEQTSLGAMAALLRRLDLYVGNDSGPAHLARAIGVRTVTLFGPTSPERWGPRDTRLHRVARHPVSCSPCPYSDCPIDHRCLARLAPTRVLEEATALLEAV